MSRLLLILSAIFGLGAAGVGYINMNRAQETSGKLKEAEEQKVQAQQELELKKKVAAEMEAKAKELETAKAEISTALESAKADVSRISSELSSVKEQIATKEQQINDLKTEMEQKLAEAKQSQDLAAATQPVEGGQGTLDELKAQKAELEVTNKSLQASLEQAESRMNQLAEAERLRAQGLARKSLEGRILAFNPAWNFAVLSVGDRQGIAANSELIVRRGDQMIGRIKVTSVEQNQSIGDVILDSVKPGMQVQPGDVVITSER